MRLYAALWRGGTVASRPAHESGFGGHWPGLPLCSLRALAKRAGSAGGPLARPESFTLACRFSGAGCDYVMSNHSITSPTRRNDMAIAKNTICLWFDGGAEDAARFYADTFSGSRVGEIHHAPTDFPSGSKGDVITVEFTVMGIPCIGLNGGPAFKQTEAFSF